MNQFQVIHLSMDKVETIAFTSESANDVWAFVNSANFQGTWLAHNRKLLRHGKGELHIKEIASSIRVTGSQIISLGNYKAAELSISNGGDLKVIWITEKAITGYDANKHPLWNFNDFGKLTDLLGKEVAYQCRFHYEAYLKTLGLKGAM